MKNLFLTFLCLCVAMNTIAAHASCRSGNQALEFERKDSRIAIADAYCCYMLHGDEPTLTANDNYWSFIIEDEPHSVGWKSGFSQSSILGDPIINLYGDFDVTVNGIVEQDVQDNGLSVSILTGVWFTTGTVLATKVRSNVYHPDLSSNQNCVLNHVRSLYAIPEQWLLNLQDTATYVIEGYYDHDNTLFFEGGIAFYVADEFIQVDTITGAETIEEEASSYYLSPVYRNIRFLKPNGIHQYDTDIQSGVSQSVLNRMIEIVRYTEPSTTGDEGSGGRVTRPIDPRPIKSRLHANMVPYNITLNYLPVPAGEKDLADNNDRSIGSYCDSVYIAQVNDSTVHVYNLYGAISEVNVFTLHNNYKMTFPVQPIDQSTEHSVFAFSMDSKDFDIYGTFMPFSISWDKTLLVNYEDLLHCYKNNSLSFIDGSTFYVPGSAVRGDVNRDGDISIVDVTALISMLLSGESEAPVILGKAAYDCNQDDKITIADVTVLISYLLSGTW